ELARAAAEAGYRRVVALGGDGTVHEVVNGLMAVPPEKRPQLAVVPIGSGNDFAFASGVSPDMQQAMIRAFDGAPARVDVGRITDGNGRAEYFDNSAGFLFDAAVNIESRKITGIHGFPMYLAATVRSIIKHYDPTHLVFDIDGERIVRNLLMLTIGNGPREGGGFMVTPDAKNDDGQFDILMVDPISRPMMFYLLPIVMQGNHGGFKFVDIRRFIRLSFDADRAVPIHLDGELWAPYEADVRRVEVEMLAGAVELVR
ncbi:MAG TPA: diacylglycerol kinase family protein, partial [Anaerolineales bacterium]|nr:diacylglycerol kinase family protein [Anaerolineales bacterium]